MNYDNSRMNKKKYPIVFDGRNIIRNKSNKRLYTIGE